jgi:dCTP deaminase
VTILSEYSILEEVCKAERSLYDERAPDELQACLDQIESKKEDPTAKDLQALKVLAREYFKLQSAIVSGKNGVHSFDVKTMTNKRIEMINTRLSSGQLSNGPLFDDFDPDLLNGMVYDLRVGHQAYLSSKKLPERLDSSESGMLRIEPGDFATLITHEYVYVPPSLMAFISVRMKYKKQGLLNVSGFHVDPSFRGRIVFTVYNAGPSDVVLQYKQPTFMMIFEKLDRAFPKRSTEYDRQTELQPEFVAQLTGTSVSPRNLDERLTRLEDRFSDIVLAIGVGVIVTIIAVILGIVFKV